MEPDKIIVKHSKGHYYLWDPEDVTILRKTHRIMGRHVGALPEIPRQNVENGLPLMLNLEEVHLLYNSNIIKIVEAFAQSDYDLPNLQAAFKVNHEQQYDKVKQTAIEEKKAKLIPLLDKIVEGKWRKLQTKSASPNIQHSPAEFREQVASELFAKLDHFPPSDQMSIFQHSSPLYSISKPPGLKLPAPKVGSIESLRIQVYADFWSKGYYISDGLKFGGDFLVYDHDPLNFHAKFIVFCLLSSVQLDASLLQSYGRLGRNVRKNVVLAYFAEDKPPRVCYRIISWNQK